MYIDKVEEFAKQIYGVKITKDAYGNPLYDFTSTELARFVELIVRECADIVEGYTLDTWSQRSGTFNLASNQIKHHFGVEE